MIDVISTPSDRALGFKLSGKLHDQDYKTFVPMIDAAIAEHGKTRILAQLDDFQGWDMHALWDDIKFATTHCSRIERIAIVGDSAWEKYMSVFCKPFTLAKIQYFDAKDLDKAWTWVDGD